MRAILLFIIPLCAFSYTQKHIKINKGSYYRYIRPQVRTILLDYKKLLGELNPKLKKVTPLFTQANEIYELSLTKESTEKEQIDEKLLEMITKLDKLKEQEAHIIDLKKKLSKAIKQKAISHFDLKNVYNDFNFFILNQLDESYRDQFNLLWIEFISPLTREIILKDNKKFLKKRLTALNIAWNSFNVHMTKRKVTLPKGTATRLEIIHRRWRSILKLAVVP